MLFRSRCISAESKTTNVPRLVRSRASRTRRSSRTRAPGQSPGLKHSALAAAAAAASSSARLPRPHRRPGASLRVVVGVRGPASARASLTSLPDRRGAHLHRWRETNARSLAAPLLPADSLSRHSYHQYQILLLPSTSTIARRNFRVGYCS